MKQKILKPLLLLIIGVVICGMPVVGYHPFAVGWFGGICIIRWLSVAAWPLMVGAIFAQSGIIAAMKYGMIMGTVGLCASQYRLYGKKYNPYIVGIISAFISAALEFTDWMMNGMNSKDMLGLIPIVLIIWSTTIIFTYFIRRVMEYAPVKNTYVNQIKKEQLIQREGMLKAANGFKNLSKKIHSMSNFKEQGDLEFPTSIDDAIEQNLCAGCENGQIQYLERARINYLWLNKIMETREAMAIQLNEMADILTFFTDPRPQNPHVIMGVHDFLKHKLRERKVMAKKIMIQETNKGRVEVRFWAKKRGRGEIPIELIEDAVSKTVGKKMRVAYKDMMDIKREYSQFVFWEEVNFMTISATAKRTREMEECSGDNFTSMELLGGLSFMSICDGMGSGRKAREYSELVMDLLEQLLESGFSESTSLKLINSIMLTGNRWNEPAAVDMALIDKYSGTCQFLKMGAACTYIKKGNWVECIRSTSLPMGVLEDVDVETITKKLYNGDFVIMVSDGMIDSLNCPDKEEAMGRIIMEIDTASPREMASEILRRALDMAANIPKDDMTVVCTGIWDNI